MDKGVKARDLPDWNKILGKAGVSVEVLGNSLKKYSSLEALIQTQQKRSEDLGRQVSKLESQLKSLTEERDTLRVGI